MAALTELAAQGTGRLSRPALGRRASRADAPRASTHQAHPAHSSCQTLPTPQAEIDNPLDLIAGHQLLAEPETMPGRPRAESPGCTCGHPICGWNARRAATATRVFLIAHRPVVGAGLRSVLAASPDIVVVGGTSDPTSAYGAVRRVGPDVILLGPGASLAHDLAAVARLRGSQGTDGPRVLLLRRAEGPAEAAQVLLAGASGCVSLDLAEDRLIAAVTLAAAGGTVFLPAPPSARTHPASLVGHAAEPPPQHCGLTDRERDVLAQLARGLSNAEIGRELALAEATVKKHLTQAMRKIGQSDRLRAALYAHRHGLAR
ncbi:response regulator transcription factor [Streptomyces sp. NBC_01803]|uniref:response regulator transcription factor n=1 Tax=Streptomyces sp. NBC_01803 TaxID=2975946 RepID=UPI002DD8EBE0|nr:response regulator transcription factor [Streptomyces sp. NBC_01803]WSA43620.1 response regulator transcription factor [Streptomyces sp. NBC_01803]